jgi:Tol biopolymer transport system component
MEIVRGSSGLWSPRWSPDGNYIVAETTDQSSMRLFNTKDCTWNDLFRFGSVDNVTWSRDSHYIYFDGHRGPQGVQDLYRVSVPDGTPEKLADMRDFVSGREGWYGVSPDGSLLALRGHLDAQIFALECRLP